jgi:hypothetical protein
MRLENKTEARTGTYIRQTEPLSHFTTDEMKRDETCAGPRAFAPLTFKSYDLEVYLEMLRDYYIVTKAFSTSANPLVEPR